MAVSRPFSDKAAAVAGIAAVREYAGMGLIADLTPTVRVQGPAAHRGAGADSHGIRRLSSAEIHERLALSQRA